ncbi:MAG: M18 family aminopeptidase [Fibrobacter sp.]|nr:M18 family aminopeptidase [Fibrobacter sp.]
MHFLEFLDQGISPFHVVSHTQKILSENGFKELQLSEDWVLKSKSSYFLKWGESSIFAFKTPESINSKFHFKFALTHTDFPCLKASPNPTTFKNGIQRIHCETYGSPLNHSWLDRDLGCAGLAVFEKNNQLKSKLVRHSSSFYIPQLAIHLNREIHEKGLKLNPQTDLEVFWSSNPKDNINSFLESNLEKDEKLLDYDLRFYDAQKASYGGCNQEWVYSGRLDNLSSCHASLSALISSEFPVDFVSGFCFFDAEEVGSETREGARSSFFKNLLKRISSSFNISESQMLLLLNKSVFASMDVAHATHPSFSNRHDPRHEIVLGKGIVLKKNANKRFASDVFSSAFFKQICNKSNLSFQEFIGRNDIPSGSTVGPALSASLGVSVFDFGIPILSMHSAREIAALQDQKTAIEFLKAFFTSINFKNPSF